MKRSEVEIGATYLARVSGRVVRVKILRDRGERPYCEDIILRHRGWDALNLDTGRTIHVRTAGRLKGVVE